MRTTYILFMREEDPIVIVAETLPEHLIAQVIVGDILYLAHLDAWRIYDGLKPNRFWQILENPPKDLQLMASMLT